MRTRNRGRYQGRPCKRCGGTDRKNGHCVTCLPALRLERSRLPVERSKQRQRRQAEHIKEGKRAWHQTERAKQLKAARRADPAWQERERGYQLSRRFRKHGITMDEARALLEKQRNKCPICDTALDLRAAFIDHDHATDQVRGLLCNPCNAAEGFLKGSPLRARKLALYLERNAPRLRLAK